MNVDRRKWPWADKIAMDYCWWGRRWGGGGGGSDFRGVFRWRLARTILACAACLSTVCGDRAPAYVCLSAAVISSSKHSGLHRSSACRLEETNKTNKTEQQPDA